LPTGNNITPVLLLQGGQDDSTLKMLNLSDIEDDSNDPLSQSTNLGEAHEKITHGCFDCFIGIFFVRLRLDGPDGWKSQSEN
jgi:hypothetical protein